MVTNRRMTIKSHMIGTQVGISYTYYSIITEQSPEATHFRGLRGIQ